MTARTPLVVVLAGPNGAGKSTTAAHLLRGALQVEEFVNADVIAQGLSAYRHRNRPRPRQDVSCSTGCVSWRGSAGTSPSRRHWQGAAMPVGCELCEAWAYRVHLVFLALPSADLAVARVADRVRLGGHVVAENVVRRRFTAGLRNLFTHYLDAVDSWQLYDNADLSGPRLIAARAPGPNAEIEDAMAWRNLKEQQQ